MADGDNIGILVVGGVGLYLLASGKLGSLFGPPPAPPRMPPPKGGPGVGAGACIAAGAATGNAAAGLALAPLCDKLIPVLKETVEGAKWATENPGTVARSLLGFGSGLPKATYEETQKFFADMKAKGGTPPTGCGGWKGACPPPKQSVETPPAPAPAPPAFKGYAFKPVGFR